jgi:acylphosphatase
MLVARQFVVRGRVQGVGFRFFAERAARAEGLSGWVQNQPDGSVEVVAEGDRESVIRFEAKLRRGPAGARIDRFDAYDDVPSGRADGFTVSSSYGRGE